MDDQVILPKSAHLADVRPSQFFQIVIIGLLLGALTWGLVQVLGMYAFKPVVCASDATVCGQANQYAVVAASLITAAIALVGLVKLRTFRPLLVVIAVTVSLWGVSGMLSGLPWYGALLTSAGLYALAYAMYAWVVRVRLFWIVIVLLVVLIVATRLILTMR